MKCKGILFGAVILAVLIMINAGFMVLVMGDEADVVSIDISQTKSYYKVGDTALGTGRVQILGEQADGSTVSLTGSANAAYSYSNSSVLTVTDEGYITAQASGGGVLTVVYTKADGTELTAKMYLGAYTFLSAMDGAEGAYPASVANKVEKITEVKRSGSYAVKLTNGGQWPMYAPYYDSGTSEIWFYDDGTSTDSFFAYFQSSGNDTTYTPRKDDPSTGRYFIGYNSEISQTNYYFNSPASTRTIANTGFDDTGMKVTNAVTDVARRKGWHQVTLVANAGQAVYDKNGTISVYLDGELIFTENYTHHFMSVLRPEGAGSSGCIFDDLIWYTNGNNIPQTAPIAKNVSVTGTLREGCTLWGSYQYYDANWDYEKPIAGTSESASPTFWQVSDDGVNNWANLSEPAQQNNTVVLTKNEAGKYIRFGVIPTSSDQNYGVINTAKVGLVTYSQAQKIEDPLPVFVRLDMTATNNMLYALGNTSNIVLYGYDANNTKIDLSDRGVATYQSNNTNVVVVDAAGEMTPRSPGIAMVRASVGDVQTQMFVIVASSGRVESADYEYDALSSGDQKRTGAKSLHLLGTANKDFYSMTFPSNGILEAWFYDNGVNQDAEVYFQTGTRVNTIPGTARYFVGVSTEVSATKYYVKNDKRDRPNPGEIETKVTQVERSVGWHQVILVFQKGAQTNDATGEVKLYLDGILIDSEQYSHDNMQVIRATVKNNAAGAFFDDFRFYNFDDIAFSEPPQITAFDGEISDVELIIEADAEARGYALTYSAEDFDLYDFFGGELAQGVIPGTGVTITQLGDTNFDPVIIKFTVDANHSGTIRLKAKKELSQITAPVLTAF